MCATLANLLIDLIDEAWLHIMAEFLENQNLNIFLDYLVNQWLKHIHFPPHVEIIVANVIEQQIN